VTVRQFTQLYPFTGDSQAMTSINRRVLVAGAAALVPASALGGPVMHPDAELLDIGEQIKKRLPDHYKARQISHALYEQTEYATGPSRPGDLSAREKWKRASNESEYSDVFERANELYSPICELAKRARKIPLRTPEGTPVKAMATLVEMDRIDIIDAIPDASAWALLEIAQLGGFAAPPWMKREGRMALLP
jgi:hypothetical protein